MKTARPDKAYNPYNVLLSRTLATDFNKRRIYADFREKQLLGLPRLFWFSAAVTTSYIISQLYLIFTF